MSVALPVALHIPDGFLSNGVAAACWLPAVAAVLYSLRVADRELTEEKVPLLGVIAAFIFAVQMINFPVVGGTSGHLLGATLAAVLLGPWLSCLVMAVVLTVQAFAFADGGITALGANLLNIGVLGALFAGITLGWGIRAFTPSRAQLLAMVGVAAWSAVMIAALATALQLAASDTIPLASVLPPMLGVHALIGIGEAVITVAAVSTVLATRPDLVGLRGSGLGVGNPAPPVTPGARGSGA